MVPEEPGLALNLGLALYSSDKFPSAIEQLNRFPEVHQDHAPAWLLVGMSHQKLDSPSMAVEPLRRAVPLDPGNSIARLELADALLRPRQPESARREFSQHVTQDGENPKAWLGLGLSYTELSSIGAGELERTAPYSACHQLLLARSAQAKGRFRAAFANFRESEALNASAPGIHQGIAAVYEEAGHPDWALAELAAWRNCAMRPEATEMLVGAGRLRSNRSGVRICPGSGVLVLASPSLRRDGEGSAPATPCAFSVVRCLPPGGND